MSKRISMSLVYNSDDNKEFIEMLGSLMERIDEQDDLLLDCMWVETEEDDEDD